ncbi:HAD-IA family hydrolase [Coralloluteibacterium stylophorae]|uniref:HAD-IA family hydrolase n=1 Tax=Coralloluteibacterium stylophorae TaxID=1776034 RepID=A0AAP2FZP2_9GAMM|nr:HAD-IA family hydrolase [Coralloluteibacterium stylophorae]MBS7458369.1 HAD-IA family hydrolase [Coralloluteibacterium stylophorae]
MMAATLFFDLDGTLIDSAEGIYACARHAMESVGAEVPDTGVLRSWIGPPLRDTFHLHFEADAGRAAAALAAYRDLYDREGWCMFHVYEGIPELLAALADAGHRMAVVTSKGEAFAQKVLASLPFGGRFGTICGTSADGSRRAKPDLVAEALRRLGAQAADAVMIGDRRYDILGARAHGLRGIGVLWGFGDRVELEDAGADAIAESPQALRRMLLEP